MEMSRHNTHFSIIPAHFNVFYKKLLLGLEVERTGIGVVQAIAIEFDAEGAVH